MVTRVAQGLSGHNACRAHHRLRDPHHCQARSATIDGGPSGGQPWSSGTTTGRVTCEGRVKSVMSDCQCQAGKSTGSIPALVDSVFDQWERGVKQRGCPPPTWSVAGELHGGSRGFPPCRTMIGPQSVDVESQVGGTTSVSHAVDRTDSSLLILSCSPTLQEYESVEAVTPEQGHLVVDLVSDEESEVSEGESMPETDVLGGTDAQDHPPQPDGWDLPTTGRVEQLLAQLATDFAAEWDAAFPNFPGEARVCRGTDSPYLGPPQQPPTPLWVDDPRLLEYSSMSEGYPEVSEEEDDWEEGSEEGEDPADGEEAFEFEEYAWGEGVDYFPEGDPILANEDELTTDGDYPSTPQSGLDFVIDERLAIIDERSAGGGCGSEWEDESSGMWSWLTTDSDMEEDDPCDPDYTG